jgi:hypothetical protein
MNTIRTHVRHNPPHLTHSSSPPVSSRGITESDLLVAGQGYFSRCPNVCRV